MAKVAEARPLDLRFGIVDPWPEADVPDGWEPVAAIARSVWQRRDVVADRMATSIVERVPAYRGSVPWDDLRESALRNAEMTLVGIAERRPPRAQEVSVRRELARRRAEQGFPVEALLRAFNIAYEVLWDDLIATLPGDDGNASRLLLQAAVTFWQWVREVTNALAETHSATVRSVEARRISARQRFVELVATGAPAPRELAHLAEQLGLDPVGPMRATVVVAPTADGDDAGALQHALDGLAGVHCAAARGTHLVTISQGCDVEALSAGVSEALPEAVAGLGLERRGLDGARISVEDAELAARVAAPGRPARYERDWLWSTLDEAAPRLEPLLGHGSELARKHPHLTATVTAFADAGFSVSEAARRLELHANTVAYRLERWHSLSGWDPRTFSGLARSVAAIWLARR